MFNKSITKRMFIGIISVVVGFGALLLLANTLLIKPLYYNSITNNMTDSMESFVKIDFSEIKSTWINEIYTISSGNSFDVIIEQNETIIYSSSIDLGLNITPFENTDIINSLPIDQKPKDPFQSMSSVTEWEETVEGIFIGESIDPRSENEFMICMSHLDSGIVIYLTQPIEPINESVTQSNILLAVCTLIVLILSIIFALKFSKSFTKPIKEIQNQVEKISNLDFPSNLEINTGDELESLSTDINMLSEKLKVTLEELRIKNAQLEKDILAQKSFISNASHELRTPLSLIKGYADELNSGFINDLEQQNIYHLIISEESSKIKRLLNEMLDLSRLESGRLEMNKEDFKLNETINLFLDKYIGYIKEKNLEIELKYDKEIVVNYDVMRFEQILANYVSNAAKYSNSNKKVIISTKEIDGVAVITVFNHGEHIDKESIKHIWDGFYKVDSSRTRSDESYGLGLSIVKAIQEVGKRNYGVSNIENGVEFWFDVEVKKV